MKNVDRVSDVERFAIPTGGHRVRADTHTLRDRGSGTSGMFQPRGGAAGTVTRGSTASSGHRVPSGGCDDPRRCELHSPESDSRGHDAAALSEAREATRLDAASDFAHAIEAALRKRVAPLRDRKVETTTIIRCHGDYHLGQVLYTGRDFVIFDLEGEVSRPLSVRRLKRSPLRDVAGMIRSFHYAAYTVLLGHFGGLRPEDFDKLDPWARFWHHWVSAAFMGAYLDAAREGSFLPKNPKDVAILIDGFLLEKALYELRYEMENRPDWIAIPVRGLTELALR